MDILQSSLSNSDFIDLYVSNSFADVKGLASVDDTRVPVPESWNEDVAKVLALCRDRQIEVGGPEFSINYQGKLYRVTHLESTEPGGAYVLRQSKIEIRDFRSLGIPKHFADVLVAEKSKGLVLFCGGFGVGKTTTAASWLVERHRQHGGVSLAIQDPVEALVDGVHGKGRCIVINASRQNGGYTEHLIRGLRSGVDFMFLGEIREPATAFECLMAGSNGELIGTTFHAAGIPEGLERLVSMGGERVAKLLADSLLGVVWQDRIRERDHNGKAVTRIMVKTLLVSGENASTVREKIRSGKISSLQQEIEQQAMRGFWKN
ncbi:pilus assembly protein PilU [Pseudomonas sp. MWU12-2115]|uniref:ATPase, T2SS/T4P/T4SS family n=1 Tax=unclassified Pseudomonas TaxID=196821 RepID=UPI000CD4D1B2|nr:ATPase, T2SS/T4P/T4SS family [Pseudomonas sp. MWU12-2020]RBB97366.1 pilus assembly protein PilU [Pseudomonas sp. MWU12-2115]